MILIDVFTYLNYTRQYKLIIKISYLMSRCQNLHINIFKVHKKYTLSYLRFPNLTQKKEVNNYAREAKMIFEVLINPTLPEHIFSFKQFQLHKYFYLFFNF